MAQSSSGVSHEERLRAIFVDDLGDIFEQLWEAAHQVDQVRLHDLAPTENRGTRGIRA